MVGHSKSIHVYGLVIILFSVDARHTLCF